MHVITKLNGQPYACSCGSEVFVIKGLTSCDPEVVLKVQSLQLRVKCAACGEEQMLRANKVKHCTPIVTEVLP